jgi:hypothetical protein
VKFDSGQNALAIAMALACLTVSCGRHPDFAVNQSTLQGWSLPFHPDTSSQRRLVNRSGFISGTPILVRLQVPLSSSLCRTGDLFKATLDEPIVSRGQTIAKGALLTGKILEAKPSDPFREAGYLRLTLTGISLGGKSWPLQTSNVFVKGATYQRDSPSPIRLAGISKLP